MTSLIVIILFYPTSFSKPRIARESFSICKTLGKAKLKSLAEKYFSIPITYRQFYRKYIKKVKEKHVVSLNELESAKRKLDKPDKSKNKKRRVGRPRRQPKIPDGVRSITTYFRSEWVNNYNVELKQ